MEELVPVKEPLSRTSLIFEVWENIKKHRGNQLFTVFNGIPRSYWAGAGAYSQLWKKNRGNVSLEKFGKSILIEEGALDGEVRK